MDRLGGKFILLSINAVVPDQVEVGGIVVESLRLRTEPSSALAERFLDEAKGAVYLVRPDQHIVARWEGFNNIAIADALNIATGRKQGVPSC